MEAKVNNSIQLTNEQVNAVVAAVNTESKSLGAIIRNFKAVCESKETALYMLQCICDDFQPNLLIRKNTNDIRAAVVASFPYVKDGVMLHKVNGIFVPYEQYSADIIKKAYYNAVGATKVQKDFVQATEEEIQAAKEKAAAKKAEKAEKKAAEKANAEALSEFVNQILAAENQEAAWTLIKAYKAKAEENQASAQ